MADALKYRGPDGIETLNWGEVAMGHCALNATPESLRETLPCRDSLAGLAITADARIDNRKQLASDLGIHAAETASLGDSQFILRAYGKWGEACVEHLLGDFAFAIWDENQRKLFLARDHAGCKPLYYHCGEGLLVFASSAKAVARIPGVGATLNEARIADYLTELLEGGDHVSSFYNEVYRLPPAHAASFGTSGLRLTRYWQLERAEELALSSDEEYLEAFTEIYTEAVRCRMRSQVEPAAMLSGGLDSSTIVALARNIAMEEGRPDLRVFSGISEDPASCPETRASRAVAASGKLNPCFLRPGDVEDYDSEVQEIWSRFEDPFDLDMTLAALIFHRASSEGRNVVLAGLDGDHVAGINPDYFIRLMKQGHLRRTWREVSGLSPHYHGGHVSAGRLYWWAVKSRLIPPVFRRFKKQLRGLPPFRRSGELDAISAELQSRVDFRSRLEEAERGSRPGPEDDFDAVYRHAITVPYLTAGVERYERVGAYCGVEVRQPLLDKRMVEFFATLPLNLKVRDGWHKYLLRLLAERYLPAEVAWREGWDSISANFNLPLVESRVRGCQVPPSEIQTAMTDWLPDGRVLQNHRQGVLEGVAEPKYDYYKYLVLHQWINAQ